MVKAMQINKQQAYQCESLQGCIAQLRHVRLQYQKQRAKQKVCCSKEGASVSVKQKDVSQTQNGDIGVDNQVDAVQTQSSNQDVECVATGLDVTCFLPEQTEEPGNQTQNDTINTKTELPPSNEDAISTILATLVLISPFFFWGTSMVAMKEVSAHTTPQFVAALRLLPAGMVLVGWATIAGRPMPSSWKAWAWIVAFALVDATAFQGTLTEGLQRTTAGLGSVIIDSQPLTVTVLAALVLGEAFGSAQAVGLALGVLGLLLLEVPAETLLSSASGGEVGGALLGEGSIWDVGEWWMLIAAQSMAVGTVMVRFVSKYCDPVQATGWHMILGALPLLAISLQTEYTDLTARLPLITTTDIASLAYVSLLGGAASYGVFFYNASRGNLAKLSSLTFLTPVFAAGAGYVVLGEVLTPRQLVGAVITLAAVVFVNQSSGGGGEKEK